jgi:hypothetical protein
MATHCYAADSFPPRRAARPPFWRPLLACCRPGTGSGLLAYSCLPMNGRVLQPYGATVAISAWVHYYHPTDRRVDVHW